VETSRASAPAKLILCGEHAVVYHRPAIALPLESIRALAQVSEGPPDSGIHIVAPDMQREWSASNSADDPLGELVFSTLRHLGAPLTDLRITLASDIPIAGGMGSGAAVATAIVRALAAYIGCVLPHADVSALVYSCEQRYHGTPSGIDNTVIAYEQPILFKRQHPPTPDGELPPPIIERISIATPFTLIIGDTGKRSETHQPVGEVRRRWQNDPDSYEPIFDQVGDIVQQARAALEAGSIADLGPLLNQNQALLETMGVSSPELEHLVKAARAAGALGAKLSGAGWGGIMLALADSHTRAPVAKALRHAGAARVLETRVESLHASGA
jgi:mevalonate kinase